MCVCQYVLEVSIPRGIVEHSRIIMLVYNGFSFVRIVVELLAYSFVNITWCQKYSNHERHSP